MALYDYTNGDGIESLDKTKPDGATEMVAILDDAIRQLKAFIRDDTAGLNALLSKPDGLGKTFLKLPASDIDNVTGKADGLFNRRVIFDETTNTAWLQVEPGTMLPLFRGTKGSNDGDFLVSRGAAQEPRWQPPQSFNVVTQRVLLVDEKPQGTHGQSIGATTVRHLNLVLVNDTALVDIDLLSNNEITLPAGKWWIEATAPAKTTISDRSLLTRAELWDNTANVTVLLGTNASAWDQNETISHISGYFEADGTTKLVIRNRSSNYDLPIGGRAVDIAGQPERYTMFKAERVVLATETADT